MKNDQADFEKNQVKILEIKEGGHFVGEETLNRQSEQYTNDNQRLERLTQ